MERDKTCNCTGLKKRRTEDTVVEDQKEEEGEQEEDMLMPSLFAECHPISNLEDINGVLNEPPKWVERVKPLLRRSSTVLHNNLSDCHIDHKKFLPRPRLDARIIPKTLVCHDYKGGYQADKYLHNVNEEILGNGYPFYNWAHIDIFVYFSHHLITIPPLCWINAGHSNGVKVLGTLITEHDEGTRICDEVFKNFETMRTFATSLVQLTKIFGFDGWLLNIENKVKNIEVLKEFVHYLSRLLHSDNPENLVIWYDSVTVTGDLLWQNKLNENNRYFFDVCDGIFLNYTWTEQHLIDSAKAAKHRNTDVFVGIDVFGRNMFGGGKLFSYKAVEMVTRHNLSMAIFAPGWTHESVARGDDFFHKFLSRDSAFWCSLWPYFYTHPICHYFTTNFYIGLDKNCYNIFNQQRPLSKFPYPEHAASSAEEYKDVLTLKDRCNCIQAVPLESRNSYLLTGKHLAKETERVHRLFVCDIEISQNTVVFCLSRPATAGESVGLSLSLLTCGVNNKFGEIRLLARRKEVIVENESVLEVNPLEARDVYDRVKSRYRRMVDAEAWRLSVYVFNTRTCNVLEVGATIEGGDSIYLGAFGIENADGDFLKSH